MGPLVDLVRWRDERETARILGRETLSAADLATQEREHVTTAVAKLRPERGNCEMTWAMEMHQPPSNPGLRLREEALLQLLDLPPRDYPPEAVGWSGVTVAGRGAVKE